MTIIEIIDVTKDVYKNTFSVVVDFRGGNMLVNLSFYKTDLAVLKKIVKELEK